MYVRVDLMVHDTHVQREMIKVHGLWRKEKRKVLALEQDILTAFSKKHGSHAADRCLKWLYRRPLAAREAGYPGFKYYSASKMPPPTNELSRIPAS